MIGDLGFVYSKLRRVSGSGVQFRMDSDQAKLFVGGISRETTEDILRDHFARYGTVVGSTISLDRSTRNPRGFGFVRFSDLSAADKALKDTHVILGRTVEVKRAIPRSEQLYQNQPQSRGTSNCCSNDGSSDQIRTKKIFVGGLSAVISEEEFKKYFERFGKITDVVVMQDNITHRPRGFGFITFDSEESVESVMLKTFHDLNGRQVEVKRAVPKEGNNGSDGVNKVRFKAGRGAPKSYAPQNPGYMLPGYAPVPWYSNNGVYYYGLNIYGCWYPMGGYGGDGYAVPSGAPRNFWYGPMITSAQACQAPYVQASSSPAYVGGRFGVVGTGTGGQTDVVASTANVKFDQIFGVNGFAKGDMTSPIEVVKQGIDSLSLKGSNGEASC